MPSTSPSNQQFHMPAEWQPHAATWIAWPHNKSDWPGKFIPIQWVYTEIARHLADSEPVRILVDDNKHQDKVEKLLSRVFINKTNVEYFQIQTDRSWTRDYGPMVVKDQNQKKHIIDFHFNGWAKYPNHKLDTKVAQKTAKTTGHPFIEATINDHPFVLEGGAIDVNGQGTVITTEECLLDQQTQVRNPGFSKKDIEHALSHYIGTTQTLWLNKGIMGDDTHGHVDDLCRFVNKNTVLLCSESNLEDDNYSILQENFERLQGIKLANGENLNVITLTMPHPVYFDGQRLPASYANFYITNHSVLVPTFNDPNDHQAIGLLQDLFPERKVIGIHAVDLIWGLGAIHCLTQQEPH